MRTWEINRNLDDGQYGIKNYAAFCCTIADVKQLFDDTFSTELMGRLPLYIDNGTDNTGYTPIITPILNRYITIKLGIKDGNFRPQIIYQFAHELTHYVFYAHLGISKPRLPSLEEPVCAAASLIVLSTLCPDCLGIFVKHVQGLENHDYSRGAELAQSLDYKMCNLENHISALVKQLKITSA